VTDLGKGATLRKMPSIGTVQAITISKQWGPLTSFLVYGHIRPSASQIPHLKL